MCHSGYGKRYSRNGQRQGQIVPLVIVCKHGRRYYQHTRPQLPAPPAASAPPQTRTLTVDLHITHYDQYQRQRHHYHHQRIVQGLHGCALCQRRIRPSHKVVHRKGGNTHRQPPAADPLCPFVHMPIVIICVPSPRSRPTVDPPRYLYRQASSAVSGGRCGATRRR